MPFDRTIVGVKQTKNFVLFICPLLFFTKVFFISYKMLLVSKLGHAKNNEIKELNRS